jgi:hypothetical protein
MEQLKVEHSDMVDDYISQVKDKTANSYMLTIARDGEEPVRTIIFYDNAIDAAFAYNKYTDWGFARKFLTVKLYEPSGKINEKVLVRDQAGECTFIRQDYIDFENLLFIYKDKIEKDVYDSLVFDVMKIFAKDNWRFNPERFLLALGVNKRLEL